MFPFVYSLCLCSVQGLPAQTIFLSPLYGSYPNTDSGGLGGRVPTLYGSYPKWIRVGWEAESPSDQKPERDL